MLLTENLGNNRCLFGGTLLLKPNEIFQRVPEHTDKKAIASIDQALHDNYHQFTVCATANCCKIILKIGYPEYHIGSSRNGSNIVL